MEHNEYRARNRFRQEVESWSYKGLTRRLNSSRWKFRGYVGLTVLAFALTATGAIFTVSELFQEHFRTAIASAGITLVAGYGLYRFSGPAADYNRMITVMESEKANRDRVRPSQ